MQLETKNLLENSRQSCYLECGSFFWVTAQGGKAFESRRGGWPLWRGGLAVKSDQQNP